VFGTMAQNIDDLKIKLINEKYNNARIGIGEDEKRNRDEVLCVYNETCKKYDLPFHF
jgi:hypothetical protein